MAEYWCTGTMRNNLTRINLYLVYIFNKCEHEKVLDLMGAISCALEILLFLFYHLRSSPWLQPQLCQTGLNTCLWFLERSFFNTLMLLKRQ